MALKGTSKSGKARFKDLGCSKHKTKQYPCSIWKAKLLDTLKSDSP